MALQIWLPLCKDGDYKNLGILGDLAVSTTPTFVDAGKIGPKSMSSGSMYMTTEQTNKVLNNDAFSIAFWIYVNLNTGTSKITTLFGNTSMSPPNNRRFTLYHYDTCNKLHVSWNNYDSSTDIISYLSGADLCPSYTWTHIALTYSKSSGKILLYKNGALYATVKTGIFLNNPTYAFQTTLMANDPNRYLQDYRVYSNCLTPQEVKEISKGLVAHYTLGSASVYEATTNIASSLTPTQIEGWGGMTITKKGNNWYHLRAASTAADSWHTFVYTLPDDCLNLTITFSAVISGITTSNVNLANSWVFIGQGNDNLYPTHGSATFRYNLLKNYLLLSWSGTLTNSHKYLIIECWNSGVASGNTGSIEFDLSAILIEKKNHITQYIDGTRSSGLVYDSSGYSRNLTIVGNVSPADSVRYDKGIYMPNQNINSNYLTSGSDWSPSFITTGSISFWCKFNGLGSNGWLPFVGLSGSYYVMAYNNGGNFYHENIGSLTKTIYRDGVVVTAPSDNGNWHHYVITGIDLSSWTNFKINQYGNSWDSNMYISDIRIYNTVLTLLDAKDLYSLGATIS